MTACEDKEWAKPGNTSGTSNRVRPGSGTFQACTVEGKATAPCIRRAQKESAALTELSGEREWTLRAAAQNAASFSPAVRNHATRPIPSSETSSNTPGEYRVHSVQHGGDMIDGGGNTQATGVTTRCTVLR